MAQSGTEFLVDGAWLQAHLSEPELILIDTRPPEEYWSGHLERARHFDPFPFHHSDTGEAGLREFTGQMRWVFSVLGIATSATVVFYENDSGMRATRGAWLLEYLGHRQALILDGGLQAMAGVKLLREAAPVTPVNFDHQPQGTLATAQYIAERLGRAQVQLFDVRSDEEYFGERIRALRSGAIPGALHRDWTDNLDARGTFKAPGQLRDEFERLGLRPECEIIPYCQGGYRSANAYYALRLAGYTQVRNYLGSWSEWGNREDLPLEKPRRRSARSPG